MGSGLTEFALVKMRLSEIPLMEQEPFLLKVWEQEKIVIQDFLCWYYNKDVVKAMQKVVEVYHNKGIEMLKFECTLSNLANICLHSSSSAKFYPHHRKR